MVAAGRSRRLPNVIAMCEIVCSSRALTQSQKTEFTLLGTKITRRLAMHVMQAFHLALAPALT